MRRLIYLSTAFRQPHQALLDTILADARSYNSTVGVTGMLVVHGSKFLQVLEGEAPQVEAVMKRVCASQKHGGIVTLIDSEVSGRLFPEWTMGYQRLATDEEVEGFVSIESAAKTFRDFDEEKMASLLDRFFKQWSGLPRSVTAEARISA